MVSGAEQQICTTWSLRDTNKVQNNLTVTDDVIIYNPWLIGLVRDINKVKTKLKDTNGAIVVH